MGRSTCLSALSALLLCVGSLCRSHAGAVEGGEELKQWALAHGTRSLLTVTPLAGFGRGLVADADVEAGATLLRVPRGMIFSATTPELRPEIEAVIEAQPALVDLAEDAQIAFRLMCAQADTERPDGGDESCDGSREARELSSLDVGEVTNFLHWAEMSMFADAFAAAKVNGEMLVDLEMEDLKEMGAGLRIQRKQLLRVVKRNADGAGVPPEALAAPAAGSEPLLASNSSVSDFSPWLQALGELVRNHTRAHQKVTTARAPIHAHAARTRAPSRVTLGRTRARVRARTRPRTYPPARTHMHARSAAALQHQRRGAGRAPLVSARRDGAAAERALGRCPGDLRADQRLPAQAPCRAVRARAILSGALRRGDAGRAHAQPPQRRLDE